MEEREELMVVSPNGGEVHSRNAHFLKPSAASAASAAAASLDPSCKGLPVKVCQKYAWGNPSPKWKTWVDKMRSSHHSTWKRAGILDAIISSTYSIQRCEDLILGLSEKWSPSTNSFVFPWGEATITLEDMMALGAYSVLGEPVFFPPSPGDEETVNKLLEARLEIYNSPAKKVCVNRWMAKFIDSGSEIEHEAFLAYWLSKSVFPFFSNSVGRSVIPIAVHLARGTRIALAPAVLASIYRALTFLKEGDLRPVKRRRKRERKRNFVVSAPLALVQLWAWERLPLLRPKPKRVGENEPRIARWVGRVIRSSTTIDSAGEDFRWRPYASEGVYMDDERWEMVESEELESFVRCVRVSKLVGLEKGCIEIEQYLPHRVAMQFGMDQDLPSRVAQDNVDTETAWSDYIRPIGDAKIYVPPRLYQPCVTSRYLEWWKKLKGEDLGMNVEAISEEVQNEIDVDDEAISEQLEDEMDVDDEAISEQLEDDLDVDDVVPQRAFIRQCSSGVNKAKSAFGGNGHFMRSKRKYLQLFRRQRNAHRHSAIPNGFECSEKSSKNSTKSSNISENSSNCSEKSSEKFVPAPMEATDLGRGCEIEGMHDALGENCLFSEKGSKCSEKSSESSENLMSAPTEASDSDHGCEVEGKHEDEGENGLFSGRSNEKVVQLSEARIDRAEEKIDLGGFQERVMNIEEILKLIRAGKLVVNKLSLKKH